MEIPERCVDCVAAAGKSRNLVAPMRIRATVTPHAFVARYDTNVGLRLSGPCVHDGTADDAALHEREVDAGHRAGRGDDHRGSVLAIGPGRFLPHVDLGEQALEEERVLHPGTHGAFPRRPRRDAVASGPQAGEVHRPAGSVTP